MMEIFLKWLVVSSADPEKTSMTVKGLLVQYVGLFLALLAVLHVGIAQETAYHYIDVGITYFGAALSLFGLIRKVYLTMKQINEEA